MVSTTLYGWAMYVHVPQVIIALVVTHVIIANIANHSIIIALYHKFHYVHVLEPQIPYPCSCKASHLSLLHDKFTYFVSSVGTSLLEACQCYYHCNESTIVQNPQCVCQCISVCMSSHII